MDKALEKLYSLRAQMCAADLPLDAIDEKIRTEEEKATSWQKDLDEISSAVRTFIQPIIQKWGSSYAGIQARFKEAELSSLLLNVEGKDIVIFQDSEDEMFSPSHSKRMKEALEVVFPDGTIIFEPQASITLGKAIKKIGPENIEPLRIRSLLSRNPDDFKAFQKIGNGYYVNTHSNTETKRKHLEVISRSLGLGLVVNVVPGVYKIRGAKPISARPKRTRIETKFLLDELVKEIIGVSPDISVDKSLKSYLQITRNSAYVANIIPRKKFLRVMLNDEYDRLKGRDGIQEAPDAHYGHMNRRFDVYSYEDISKVIEYIVIMLNKPDSQAIPGRIRIRLNKTAPE